MINPRRSAELKSAVAGPLTRVAPGLFERAHAQYRWVFYRRAGFAFCHIPKNAGSSLAIASYGRRLGHIRASTIRSENRRQLPIVTITREPIDRFASAYRYATGGGGSDGIIADPEQYAGVGDIGEFIERFVDIPEADRDPVFRSQSYYLDLDPDEVRVGELFVATQSDLGALRQVPAIAATDFDPSERVNVSTGAVELDGFRDRLESVYADDFTIEERFELFSVRSTNR